MQAEIILHYRDSSVALAVARALSPDNLRAPSGLAVTTLEKQQEVVTEIKCEGKMDTFIATIDDLLFSASVAENTLRVMMQASTGALNQ